MFGEAFAAELNSPEKGESVHIEDDRVVPLRTLGPKWMVGEGDGDGDCKETEEDSIFSKYVFGAVKGSFLELDVFRTRHRSMTQEQWDEEDELFLWLKHNKASLNSTKLKSIIRRHIPPAVRARLWQEVSGGTRFMSRVPNLYHDTCEKLFGKDVTMQDSTVPCTLSNDDEFMSYYLTPDGVISLRRVLQVLSFLHPDITYSPILQQVAAVFLHFMEEVWCFACLSAMLTGKKMYFEQTHLQASASDYALHTCASSLLKKELRKLKTVVMDAAAKPDATLFPEWEKIIFQYMDFTVLVRLVDCFLAEGPKVFFRTGLFLIRLFYEYTLKFERLELPTSSDLMVAIGQYSQALKIPADDFIKAILRIRLRNRQINTAIQKYAEDRKDSHIDVEKTKEAEKSVNFDITDISDILTHDQWRTLVNWLPARIQLLKPTVAFTTDYDGFSLKTMYNKVEEEDQAILILKTDKDEVFGAYMSMSLTNRNNSRKNLSFFGNGETFLFSMSPLIEKFAWTEIDEVDSAKQKPVSKQKSSFVFVDIKGSPRRKRRSFRITRRKVSVKLQGIPKNFSLADIPSQTSYGGIKKNSSVVHLHNYSSIGDTGYSSEQTSPILRLRGISASTGMKLTKSTSPDSSVSSNPTPKSKGDSSKTETDKPASPPGKSPYQHSLSQGEAGDYPQINEEDLSPSSRVTPLPDDLCLVEKRVEIDEIDSSGKTKPEHAHHVMHAPSDMFIAGDNNCFMVGGGGGNGIWLDENLYRGRSQVCNTFHNRVLTKASSGDFICVRLEVFSFREPEL